MAPVQSRPRLGPGLLVGGGIAGTQLFLNLGSTSGSMHAPRTTSNLGSQPHVSSDVAGNGTGFLAAGFPALAIACSALAVNRAAMTRGKSFAAVATADAESVPPPFNPAGQIGAVEPLGFFDPLGFTKLGDEDGFRKLRTAEIKHGRVAMMASIGAVGQHWIRFPGFENTHGTFGALATGEGILGFTPLFFAAGILELAWRENPDKEAGNYGNPFNVQMYTTEMRDKEINNGRMAMISMLGIFAAELATGKDAIEQFGF